MKKMPVWAIILIILLNIGFIGTLIALPYITGGVGSGGYDAASIIMFPVMIVLCFVDADP